MTYELKMSKKKIPPDNRFRGKIEKQVKFGWHEILYGL